MRHTCGAVPFVDGHEIMCQQHNACICVHASMLWPVPLSPHALLTTRHCPRLPPAPLARPQQRSPPSLCTVWPAE